MASDRADPALSPAVQVISFVIAGKTWKLGDSWRWGRAKKRKWWQLFGRIWAEGLATIIVAENQAAGAAKRPAVQGNLRHFN